MIHKNSIATHKWQLSCTGYCMSSFKKLFIAIVILVYIKCPVDGQKFLVAVALETEAKLDKKRGTVKSSNLLPEQLQGTVEANAGLGPKGQGWDGTVDDIPRMDGSSKIVIDDLFVQGQRDVTHDKLSHGRDGPNKVSLILEDDDASGRNNLASLLNLFSNTAFNEEDTLARVLDGENHDHGIDRAVSLSKKSTPTSKEAESGNDIATTNPFTQGKETGHFKKQDRGSLRGSKDVDSVATITEIKDILKLQVASYPDSSLPKDMMAYVPDLNSFSTRPSRDSSDLSDDYWYAVNQGLDAADIIVELLDSYSYSETTTTTSSTDVIESFRARTPPIEPTIETKDAIEALALVANTVGVFVPQFAFVGAALTVATLFIPESEAEPDPMLALLNERINSIERTLTNLRREVESIKLYSCEQTLDDNVLQYLTAFKASYASMIQPGATRTVMDEAKVTLKHQCVDDSPSVLMESWNILMSGGDRSGCLQEIIDNSDHRVLYFHKNWVTYFLNHMLQAAEYQGICDGLYTPDVLSTAKATVSDTSISDTTISDTVISGYFTDMHDKFREIESHMYESTRSQWQQSLLSNYGDAIDLGDSNTIFKALATDFFPDFKYAVSLITPYDDLEYVGNGNSNMGSFTIGRMIVMYRASSDTTTLPRLEDGWTNLVCPGPSMCTRHEESCNLFTCRTLCEPSHCWSVWHELHENLKRNNEPTYELYAERGAFMVKTESRREECIPNANAYCSTRWIDESAPTITVVGDPIYESFQTSAEIGGRRLRDWSKYTIVGVSGNFPHAVPISVSNALDPYQHGMYFEFLERRWNAVFGPLPNSDADGNVVPAQHWRGGNMIWRGNFKVWKAGGTEHNPHSTLGRRSADVSSATDIQDGDVLIQDVAVPISVSDALDPYEHGMYFEFDENIWNAVFGPLPNSDADGNVVPAQHSRGGNVLWRGNFKVWRAGGTEHNPHSTLGRRSVDVASATDIQDGDVLIPDRL